MSRIEGTVDPLRERLIMAEPTSQRNPVTVALIAAIAALGVTGVGLGVLANNGFFSPASAAPVPETSASPGSSGTSRTTGTSPKGIAYQVRCVR